ncbi:MAG TPA: DUF1801 domain-containing protein [Candidatus Thermoplasmatota archaeon]|nr:DUF1801 domain-containing protein [Candidatus Thermoplasmatota archaeon]
MGQTQTGQAAVDQFLATVPAPMGEVARHAAAKIRSLLPNAHETCEGGDCGFGVAEGYRGLVFTLHPEADHVTMGIAGGASLSDPTGLLEGRGGTNRHVKLRSKADVDRASLDRLLKEAVKRRAKR